jgi:hypothetical protein
MKDLLNQIIGAVRSWLGWENIEETRMSPEHGWLLPQPATVAAIHPAANAAAGRGARTADRR